MAESQSRSKDGIWGGVPGLFWARVDDYYLARRLGHRGDDVLECKVRYRILDDLYLVLCMSRRLNLGQGWER